MHLILRFGYFGDASDWCLSKKKSKGKIPRVKRGPSWRRARHGLNIEGKCHNPQCSAVEKLTISRVGFGPWTLKSEVPCPECSWEMILVAFALFNCSWMFEGVKKDGTFDTRAWRRVVEEVHIFEEMGQISDWDALVVCARKFHENECCICLEEVTEGMAWRADCAHQFHKECLFIWANLPGKLQHPACPLCTSRQKRPRT